ncbi:MAG: threonine synthase [Lachnospiraceae bacterium]|nr:threonine synthase [Lachnospiraceae bacterium]
MRYISTRDPKRAVSAADAVISGIAPDGGLYIPEDPDFGSFDWKALLSEDFRGIAERIFSFYFEDLPGIPEIVGKAYGPRFDTPEVTPLKKVGDRFVLELFHGPTSAFKDVALQALPLLLSEARKVRGITHETVILTATSGDTGKAALEGFRDVPGTRIIVFFPDGGVSTVQRAQMVTQEGGNVCSVAVRGNFDDTQTGVKQIFVREKAEGLPGTDAALSSANSINIGRLVPQIAYYFKAYADLVKAGEIRVGDPIDFTVPTGNFGDILAGYLAYRMGLPVGKLVCASNKNDVLTEFIGTGVYDKNRPFYKTTSPSMDILVSSNLERLLYFLSEEGDEPVSELMKKLTETGRYKVSPRFLEKLQALFDCGAANDEEVADSIREVFTKYGYLLDPHTAAGWHTADRYFEKTGHTRPNVVLSTASPYKFPQAVLEALGIPHGSDEFEMMDLLSEKTGVQVPYNLSSLRGKEERFTDVVDKEEMYAYVIRTLEK